MYGILFRCVSRCCLKLAASFLSSLISPGMVLKRAGPEEQNELNLRVSTVHVCSPGCFRAFTLRTKSGIEVELQLDVFWIFG